MIFTSDNGGFVGQDEEQQAHDARLSINGIYRGGKSTIWEGGFRVPFVARWPGHIEEGAVSDRMINLVDIFATIQEMISGEVLPPQVAGVDSYSFYDELIGERNENAVRPHMVVNSGNGTVAIRKGPWKYIEGETPKEGPQKMETQQYKMGDDITESENCIREFPDMYDELMLTLENIRDLGSERLNMKK